MSARRDALRVLRDRMEEHEERMKSDPKYKRLVDLKNNISAMRAFRTHPEEYIKRYEKDHMYAIENNIKVVLGKNRKEIFHSRYLSPFGHGECWKETDDYKNDFYMVNGKEVTLIEYQRFKKLDSICNGRTIVEILKDDVLEIPEEANWIFQDPYDTGIGTSVDKPSLSGGEDFNKEYRMCHSVKTLKIPHEISIDWKDPIKITPDIRMEFQIIRTLKNSILK